MRYSRRRSENAYQIADGIGVAVTVHFNVTMSPALEMIGVSD